MYLLFWCKLFKNKVDIYTVCKFKWIAHSAFFSTKMWHVQASLQIQFFFWRILTVLVQELENFVVHLDYCTLKITSVIIKTNGMSKTILFSKKFDIWYLQCCVQEVFNYRSFSLFAAYFIINVLSRYFHS